MVLIEYRWDKLMQARPKKQHNRIYDIFSTGHVLHGRYIATHIIDNARKTFVLLVQEICEMMRLFPNASLEFKYRA